MSDWIPTNLGDVGPLYLQIVGRLEQDIAKGVLARGARLLPHRDMADRLKLSVGTVAKAYDEAERRGLISGEVGRGTFVLGVTSQGKQTAGRRKSLNLALNAPPATGEAALIAETLEAIATDSDIDSLLPYLPHQGAERHRYIIAGWLSHLAVPATSDCLYITHGGQHAISIAMRLLAGRGDAVLAENLTYSGLRALASHEEYQLRGVLMDKYGLIPEELDRAFRETGARIVYCMPTLQTPTGSTMPSERRDQIVEIVRSHDAYLIEDDAYGFLCEQPIAPLATRIPERCFYVVSFAKCLAPGLRVGAMLAPAAFRDRCVNAVRSTGWMATPMMVEVVAQLIQSGQLDEQVRRKRETARRRHAMAMRILADRIPIHSLTPAFHVWLPMPPGRTIASLIADAAMADINLASPDALQSSDPMSNGVRLCLGLLESDADVEFALQTLRNILDNAETMAIV
jgi:DNA-binding transcriptional MocR family regulator